MSNQLPAPSVDDQLQIKDLPHEATVRIAPVCGHEYRRLVREGTAVKYGAITEVELTAEIRAAHDLHGNPGVRRVWTELVVRGWAARGKRVWCLLCAAGLRGRHSRRSRARSPVVTGPSRPRNRSDRTSTSRRPTWTGAGHERATDPTA